jgi:kynurenine formamidase
MKIVYLSQPLVCGRNIQCEIPARLPIYMGHACEEYQYSFHSHRGSYFETSAHLYRGGKMTSQVPVSELLLPALIPRLDSARDGAIEAEELSGALKGELPPAHALIVDAQGKDKRFFSRRCGAWMAEKKVALLGATMPKYDTGFVNPTGIFVELFDAEIPIIANLQNVDKLAHDRVFLIVLPLAIESACTVPCRIVALDGEPDEIDWMIAHLGPGLGRERR